MNIKQRKPISYVMLFALITLDVTIMLLEKLSANIASDNGIYFYINLLCIPWTWLAIFLAAGQLWVWTRIIARTELSIAYPISSLSYPLTVLAAQLFLKEQFDLKIWIGVLFITIGVAIVGSKAEDSKVSLTK